MSPDLDTPKAPPGPVAAKPGGRLRWGAIAIGAATDIGSSQLFGTLILMSIGIRMPRPDSPADVAAAQAAMQAAMATPAVFIFTSVVGLMCSVAGGYLTGYLAKTRQLLHATMTGLCSVVAGSLLLGSIKSDVGFTELALTAATIPAAMLGGLIARWLCGHTEPRLS